MLEALDSRWYWKTDQWVHICSLAERMATVGGGRAGRVQAGDRCSKVRRSTWRDLLGRGCYLERVDDEVDLSKQKGDRQNLVLRNRVRALPSSNAAMIPCTVLLPCCSPIKLFKKTTPDLNAHRSRNS
jgi:hypothetical protein